MFFPTTASIRTPQESVESVDLAGVDGGLMGALEGVEGSPKAAGVVEERIAGTDEGKDRW